MTSYTYEFLELGEEHALGCKCCRFSFGTDLPIPKKLSLTEIDKHATAFSAQIFKDWTALNAIIKRFEGTIHKRWLRKSSQQRRRILLQAWPEMPTTHRPDFLGFRDLNKKAPRSRTCLSNAFLWPYINLEDLQQRHLLLLFLNSRARNFPDKFVSADIEAAHYGEGWSLPLSDDQTMVQFLGLRSPRTYGKLVPREGLESRKQSGCYYHPQFGLLILEIQHGIYSFLASCAKLILHDLASSQFFVSPFQPEPEMGLPPSNEWPSLTSHMLELPYRAPEKMDLDRLKLLVSTRRGSAEDHIWLLREDPSYFVEALKQWKEHDEGFLKHSCHCSWRAVADRMIGDAFSMFLFWHWIYQKLDMMSPLEEQIRFASHRAMRLRKKDEVAWAELLNIVDALILIPLTQISTGLPPSPRLRHCFSLNTSVDKAGGLWDTKRRLNAAESRVEILFRTLCNYKQHELHSLSHVVNEIQYMLDTDHRASELIDSWILEHFSNLAMLSELRSRISGFEPWSGAWYADNLFDDDTVVNNNDKLFALDNKLRFAFKEIFAAGSIMKAVLGDPTSGRFDHPATKSYTETNVDQMRLAETRLDAFWAVIESGVEAFAKISIPKFLARRLLEPRELYRTPKWVAPKIVTKKASQPLCEVDANVSRFGSATLGSEATNLAKLKTKVKTRGAPASPVTTENREPTMTPDETVNQDEPMVRVKVPKRAYKVLSALLPEPSAAHHQRTEVAWDEFLQAMNLIGFQPEKLYGSVWILMPRGANGGTEGGPTKRGNRRQSANYPWTASDGAPPQCLVNVQRSIQFHEPKEVRKGSKIPYYMLRTFGRRFKHAYGWQDGMFICG